MESYLKGNFDRLSKNLTNEALQRWRKLCGVVKNPKRRFRFAGNLLKRLEAQATRRTNQGEAHEFSVDGLPEVSPVEIDSESGTCETDTLLGEKTGEAHEFFVDGLPEISPVEIDSESSTCETVTLLDEKTGSGQSFRSFGSTDEISHQDGREIPPRLPISISSSSVTDIVVDVGHDQEVGPTAEPTASEKQNVIVVDVGHDQEVGPTAEPTASEKQNVIVVDVGHDQEVGPTAEPTASEKQNVPQPWAKVIVVMAFTSVVGLLGVTYTINRNGNLTPATLFNGRRVSFGFFLLVVMITFFISIIAMIIRPVLPLIAKVLNIMAFFCVVLGITVLLWALHPKHISWVPWIFFAVTILITFGVIVYEWFVYVKKFKEKGTTIRPTT